VKKWNKNCERGGLEGAVDWSHLIKGTNEGASAQKFGGGEKRRNKGEFGKKREALNDEFRLKGGGPIEKDDERTGRNCFEEGNSPGAST